MSNETLNANKQLTAAFFQAINDGRYADAAALLDPNGTWWALARRADRPALVQLDRIHALANEAKAGMRFTINTMTAEDDRVAVECEGYAEFDDRVYNNLYCFLVRVEAGRLAQLWMYDDTALGERVLRGDKPLGSHRRTE
jgi:ketosteroid isomerase-like protein